MIKYKVGDLVRINQYNDGYELIVDETGLTHEDVGLITNFVSRHTTYTVGGKPIIHRDWYDVLFCDITYDFEEWELEPL